MWLEILPVSHVALFPPPVSLEMLQVLTNIFSAINVLLPALVVIMRIQMHARHEILLARHVVEMLQHE